MKVIQRIIHIIRNTVGVAATLVMGSMVALAFSQLIARWAFNSSIAGADLMLRQMVLIIGLLGGVLAAADNRHIRIDLADNFIKGIWKNRSKQIVNSIASMLAGYLAWISISFVQSERQATVVLRGLFFGYNVEQWYIEILIPVCFSLMAILFLFSSLASTSSHSNSGIPN